MSTFSLFAGIDYSAARGSLERYFNPPLTIEERRVAEREG